MGLAIYEAELQEVKSNKDSWKCFTNLCDDGLFMSIAASLVCLELLTRLISESALMFSFSVEQMVDTKFRALLDHSLMLLRKKWLYGILDDFVTKQLPNNVTWGLSLLYALEHKGDRALVSTQGEDVSHFIVVQTSVTTFSQQYLPT